MQYKMVKVVIAVLIIYVFLNLILPYIAKGLSVYFLTITCWTILAAITLIIGMKEEKLNLFTWRTNSYVILNAAMIGALQITTVIFLGFFTTFGKSPYAFTPIALTVNIAYFSSALIAIELSRTYIIKSCPKRKIFTGTCLTTLFFTFISLPLNKFISPTTAVETVEFIGASLIPTLAQNLLATYLALIGGPTSSIAYMGTLQAFEWLSPILPNPVWPIKALANTLAPTIGFLTINQTTIPFKLMQAGLISKQELTKRTHKTQKSSTLSWITITTIALILVWSSSGLLGFTPTIIASGSMQPTLNPGDIAIVITTPPEKIKVGDIIQYQTTAQAPTIHRVIDKYTSGGTLWFITQGDANNAPDDPISERQVMGKVILTIPKLGWISIYLKEFFASAYTFFTTTLPNAITEGTAFTLKNGVYITTALALTAYSYLLLTYHATKKEEKT